MHTPAVPIIAAAAIAAAWLPVLVRFLRSWRSRGNPISLAICILIAVSMYVPCYLAATLAISWPLATVITVDALTCATFYVAIAAASRKFPDTRRT